MIEEMTQITRPIKSLTICISFVLKGKIFFILIITSAAFFNEEEFEGEDGEKTDDAE